MPVKLPRRLARFNKRVVNPIQLRYAWLLPPWVVIVHRGRRSGRVYRTPVNGYLRGRTLAVALFYGADADWVRNVLAGDARVVRGGRTYSLARPRVIEALAAGVEVPAPARVLGRMSGKLLVAELGERAPGFGRGPRADV